MDFTEHADDGEECILLKLVLKLKLTGKVLLEKLVLDEWESGGVKLFNQFVDKLEGEKTDGHLWVHVVLKHQVVFIFIFDESLWLISPLLDGLQRQIVLEE